MKAHGIIEIMDQKKKSILGHFFHIGSCGIFVPGFNVFSESRFKVSVDRA